MRPIVEIQMVNGFPAEKFRSFRAIYVALKRFFQRDRSCLTDFHRFPARKDTVAPFRPGAYQNSLHFFIIPSIASCSHCFSASLRCWSCSNCFCNARKSLCAERLAHFLRFLAGNENFHRKCSLPILFALAALRQFFAPPSVIWLMSMISARLP